MPRKLILKNFQSPGDILMLTATVRDLHLTYPGEYLTDVRTPFPQLWEHNPHVTPLQDDDSEATVISMHYPLIHESNAGAYHFVHGFTRYLAEQLDRPIKVHRQAGDIHLTDEERSWISMVEQHYSGSDTPYWLICSGGKKDYTAKWWIPEYAQQVVDHFRDRIQFVQFGDVGTNHHHPPLDGVINLVGQTDIRMFTRLMYHAEGVICPVTFAMHLAAAVPTRPGKPVHRACVVTAGGREPSTFTFYGHHQYLHTNGAFPCCQQGGCWKSRIVPLGDQDQKDAELCVDTVELNARRVQRCMHDGVTAQDVIRAVQKYYDGGVLQFLPPECRSIAASWDDRISQPLDGTDGFAQQRGQTPSIW